MNAIIKAPLTGELLPPGEMLAVSAVMHPFRTAADIVMVPAGSSVAEIVEACQRQCATSRLSVGADVTIGGHLISRDLWTKVRVKPGALVLVRARAGKGFGSILKAVFSIGLLIIGSFLTAGFGPLVGGLLTAGIGLAGNLLINALFPPSTKQADGQKTLYSIGSPRNRVRRWEPVSSVLGEVRKAADHGADPYTEFVGDDQYLRLLLVWGFGPLDISDIRIGKTPITDYDDVEIQTFYGYETDAQQTLYSRQVVQDDVQIEVTQSDSPIKLRTAEDATEVQFDLLAPQGIADITYKTGKKKTQEVKGYARLLVPGTSTIVKEVPWDMSDNDTNPKRVTFRITGLPGNASYDFRLYRTTRDYDDSDQDESDNVDNVTMTALRTFRKAPPINFPLPLAITALRIRATKQLSGVPDDITALVRTRAKKWTGTLWSSNQVTRNPGDLYRHVLQGPANRRPRTDAQIDLPAIQAFSARCTSKGFTFDMDRDFRASVFETAKDVLAAGRAVPILKDGKWSVAYETPTAPIVQHFTPQNSWNMRRKQTFSRKPNALRVKYADRDREYEENERLVFDDGYTKANATLTEMLELPGVTDRGLIHKHGRYRLAELYLRPAIFTLNVDAEHLRCNKGDRVYVASDVLMNTLATGRVKGVAGQVVTLTNPVTMDTGTYAILFRLRNGSFLQRTVVTNAGVNDTVTLVGTGAVPSVPANRSAGDVFSFWTADQVGAVYRIKEIRSGGDDLSAELDLVDDAPDIERADTQPIPDYDSGLVQPIDPSSIPPYKLRLEETIEIVNGVAVFVATLLFDTASPTGVSGFIAIATNGARTVRVDSTMRAARFENLTPGVWTFTARSVLTSGRWTRPSEALTVSVQGQNRPPPDIDDFRIAVTGDIGTLSWTRPSEPVAATEVRYSPVLTGAMWQNAVPIVSVPADTSAQVPFQSGTYLAKHISFGGVASANPVLITITNAGLASKNVVEQLFETSPFTGTHEHTWDGPGGLQLDSSVDVYSVPDIYAVPDTYFAAEGYAPAGTYTLPETIDLGEAFTSRVTATLMAEGRNTISDVYTYPDIYALDNVYLVEPSDWSVEVEVRTTLDDPAASPTWSDWSRLVMGDYAARAFQFRVQLGTTETGVTPAVSLFEVTIDMPDRVEGGNDLVVPTGGLRVNFIPAFRATPAIATIDQNLQTGDYKVVGNKGPTGFDIAFKDSAGAAISRTFDYVARGYGRKVN